jgi:Zn-dependent protease
MDVGPLVQTIAIYALPVLLAITLHEAAHGYVARHFGDLTAYAQGRISLNPLRHIDPVGTILVPGIILVLSTLSGVGAFLFGWAKPVPVNYSALRKPRQHMAWVAAAGPGANLAMTLGWALLFHIAPFLPSFFAVPLGYMSEAGIRVNLVLMFLNLLPILPLDGGRIVASLLPGRAAWQYAKLEPWGLPVIVLLLVTGTLGTVLRPLVYVSESLLR